MWANRKSLSLPLTQVGADSAMPPSYEHIPIKEIMLEKGVYQALTKIQYRSAEGTTISSLINEKLKEYLHTYILSKTMGHMLISKDVIRIAVEAMSDEQIAEAAAANAVRYKEGAIIEHGEPSLAAYLLMIKAFAKANKFEMEVSKNPENDNQVLVIGFRMGKKFSELKATTYRILFEEFAEIEKVETTGGTAYLEYKTKKEQVIKEST